MVDKIEKTSGAEKGKPVKENTKKNKKPVSKKPQKKKYKGRIKLIHNEEVYIYSDEIGGVKIPLEGNHKVGEFIDFEI